MTYLALYRAWRPQIFGDVVGQEHITHTLNNALREKRYSHAYLFNGPRGTGKTSTAKIFAKAINCELGINEEPCNKCSTCLGITEGSIMDVVEIDAASNRGVEEIRDLREKVKFSPTETRYKVYIIDEVHMLTTEAFNALLKTLEEPPAHVIFILATTEPHKLPLTIISRCQRFDFKRVTSESMLKRLNHILLAEGFKIEEEALSLIVRHSEGGMRDALSLVDQVLSYSKDEVSLEDVLKITGRASRNNFAQITKHIHNNEVAKVLNIVNDLIKDGKDPEKLLEDLLYYFRDLLLFKSAPDLAEVLQRIESDLGFKGVASTYSDEHIYRIIEQLNQYLYEIKGTNQTRLILELAMVKITRMLPNSSAEAAIPNEDIGWLKLKIKELENKVLQLTNDNTVIKESSHQKNGKNQVAIPREKGSTQVINKLTQIKDNFSDENLLRVKKTWGRILQTVKQKKITVHAWLVDGEPVAVTKEIIIITFNNIMHKETTEKLANRQLIEEVVGEILEHDFSILTVMLKDWQAFKLEHGDSKSGSIIKQEDDILEQEDKFVNKAIEIFGEKLVVIKD